MNLRQNIRKLFIFLLACAGGASFLVVMTPGVVIVAFGLIFFNLGFAILKFIIKVANRYNAKP